MNQQKTTAGDSDLQLQDKRGTEFDPALHATNHLGEPKMTSAGYFRKRQAQDKRERVRRTDEEIDTDVSAAAAAKVTVQMIYGTLAAVGGADWQATDDEIKISVMSWQTYYIESGTRNVPGWVMIMITTSAFVATRIVSTGLLQKFTAHRRKVKLEKRIDKVADTVVEPAPPAEKK